MRVDRRGMVIRAAAGGGSALLIAGLVALSLHGSSQADAAPGSGATSSSTLSTSTSKSTLSSEPPTSALNSGTATKPQLAASRNALVLGDSLGLDVYPYLADLMPDRYVAYAAVVGRDTPATLVTLRGLTDVPPLVLVSLGTNDLSADSFRVAAEGILALLGPDRCVVWADVVRPESIGGGAAPINRVIDDLPLTHHNVHVLAWSTLIDEHPDWLSGDGIHPGQVGSQARAKAFADAAFDCSPFDSSAPRASQQYLAPSVFDAPGGGGTSGQQGQNTTRSTPPQPVSKSASPTSTGRPSSSTSRSVKASGSPPAASTAAPSTNAPSHSPVPAGPPSSPAPTSTG